MYKYPESLVDYLTEQESEGNEIFTTKTQDGTAFIIKYNGLDKWITYVDWYDGQDDYQMVNICGSAFARLARVMEECIIESEGY